MLLTLINLWIEPIHFHLSSTSMAAIPPAWSDRQRGSWQSKDRDPWIICADSDDHHARMQEANNVRRKGFQCRNTQQPLWFMHRYKLQCQIGMAVVPKKPVNQTSTLFFRCARVVLSMAACEFFHPSLAGTLASQKTELQIKGINCNDKSSCRRKFPSCDWTVEWMVVNTVEMCPCGYG